MLYCIGFYLARLSDEEAMDALSRQSSFFPVRARPGNGQKTRPKAQSCCSARFKRAPVRTSNIAYNDTIWHGLPAFFRAYDADFAAHDTPGMIDYPLFSSPPEAGGAAYVADYLESLYLENLFCTRFPPSAVHSVLGGYDTDYAESLINIFEHILGCALGCALAGQSGALCDIGPEGRRFIMDRFGKTSKSSLEKTVEDAAHSVCTSLQIADGRLYDYVISAVGALSGRIENALRNACPETLFTAFKDAPRTAVVFEDAANMDDETLRFRHGRNQKLPVRFGQNRDDQQKRQKHRRPYRCARRGLPVRRRLCRVFSNRLMTRRWRRCLARCLRPACTQKKTRISGSAACGRISAAWIPSEKRASSPPASAANKPGNKNNANTRAHNRRGPRLRYLFLLFIPV